MDRCLPARTAGTGGSGLKELAIVAAGPRSAILADGLARQFGGARVFRDPAVAGPRTGADRCCDPPAAVAREAGIVVMSADGREEGVALLARPDGLLAAIRPGVLVVDVSPVAWCASPILGALVARTGAVLVDAPLVDPWHRPLTGKPFRAVGADPAAFGRVRPLLDGLGCESRHVGPPGSGYGLRLALSLMNGGVLSALCETLMLGCAAGVEPELFYQVVRVSRGDSAVFRDHFPRILARDVNPRRVLDDMVADLDAADAVAAGHGMPAPMSGVVRSVFRGAQRLGYGREDVGAVVRVSERFAGTQARGVAEEPTFPPPPPLPSPLPKCGFVGLGIMGGPMALNLARAGIPLTVFDRSPAAISRVRAAAGAEVARSVAEVGAACEIVFLSLPDHTVVEQVALGGDGLLSHMRAGATLIDTSTSLPALSRRLADEARARGIGFIDAPVSGGPEGAQAASLTLIVGADADSLAKAMPLLRLLGSKVFRMGPPGTGHTMKVLHSAINVATLGVLAEALMLARLQGLAPELTCEVISEVSPMGIVESRAPRILAGDFDPGATIDILQKDVFLVSLVATDLRYPIPVSETARMVMQSVRARGLRERDIAAIVTTLEEFMGLELRASRKGESARGC